MQRLDEYLNVRADQPCVDASQLRDRARRAANPVADRCRKEAEVAG
jgi:hypothetical protein